MDHLLTDFAPFVNLAYCPLSSCAPYLCPTGIQKTLRRKLPIHLGFGGMTAAGSRVNNDLLAFVKIMLTFSWYGGGSPQNYEDNKMTITHQIMINIPIAEVINIGCMWQLTRMPILITLEVSYVSLATAALIYPVFNKSTKSDEKRHFRSMKTYVLWNYTMHRGINLPHDDNLCNCQHKSRRIGQF